MTDFIGASLGDLEQVDQGFSNWRDVSVDSGKTVLQTSKTAVVQLRLHTIGAKDRCLSSIDGMKSQFRLVLFGLENARYKGENALTAREAGADMDERATKAVADMNTAFEQFVKQIDALGEDLEEIATAYDQYATSAGDSAESMSIAMRRQRENLDAAMRGMTY